MILILGGASLAGPVASVSPPTRMTAGANCKIGLVLTITTPDAMPRHDDGLRAK